MATPNETAIANAVTTLASNVRARNVGIDARLDGLDAKVAPPSTTTSAVTSLVQKSTANLMNGQTVNVGDVLGYRGFRVAMTKQTTIPTGVNPWFSAANYTIVSGGGEVFYAYDYGVRATGDDKDAAANDTALAAAIDAAFQQGGGTVQLPSGNIRFSGGLEVKEGVCLQGGGTMLSTVLQAKAGANYDWLVRNKLESGKNHMLTVLRNFMVDGRKADQTAGKGYGIYLTTNPLTSKAGGDRWFDPHHVIDNVWAYVTYGDGFRFEGRSALQANRIFASQCGGWGVWSTFDTNIGYGETDSCALGGFHFDNGSNRLGVLKAYLSGNGVSGATSPGFYFGPNASGINGAGLEAQNNTGAGFLLQGCKAVSLFASADSNWKNPMADGPGPSGAGFVLDGAIQSIIVGTSTQGKQNSKLIGNQQNAVSFTNSPTGNVVTVTHTGIQGATVGSTVDDLGVPTGNSVTVGGATPVTPAAATVDPNVVRPADRGYVAWSESPLVLTGNEATVANRLYVMRVVAEQAAQVTKLRTWVATGQASSTGFMAIYDASGNLLGQGALDASASGIREVALSSAFGATLGALYNVAVCITSTGTQPNMMKNAANITGLNMGLPAAAMPFTRSGTAAMSVPSSLPSDLTGTNALAMWVGLA